MVLSQQARSQGKTLVYLESPEEQMLSLSSLSEADQLAMLVATLTGLRDNPDSLDDLVAAWAAGDQAAMTSQFVDIDALGSQGVYDALIVRRNQNWIPKITALLDEPGVKFVAVGAGHLLGEHSVPAMLTQRGYRLSCQ